MPSYSTDPATGIQVLSSNSTSAANRLAIERSLANLEARVSDLEEGLSDSEYAISTFEELQAAVTAGRTRVHLYDDITVTAAIVLPASMTILYRGKLLIDGGFSVSHNACVGDMTREQKFSGFVAGDITGTFGNGVTFPEWWGLTDGYHDVAINCCLSAYVAATRGNKVSLAGRRYDVSAPLDMRTKLCYLEGQGCGSTSIESTANWTATWVSSTFWSAGVTAASSHSGMILIGSISDGVQSFRTGIRGVTVDGYNACAANPTKRISLITAFSWVEECNFVEDALLAYFTGFGVGFHTSTGGVSVVNGFSLSKFWIHSGMKRDAVPIYIPPHAVTCSVRDGTIDCTLRKAQSSAWSTAPADPDPGFVRDWPLYGILAAGYHTSIDNIHIEGVGIGIHVYATSTPESVTISNIDGHVMMDDGLIYYDDPARVLGPPPQLSVQESTDNVGGLHGFYWHYGAVVTIGRTKTESEGGSNYNANVSIRNLRSQGTCKYLLRDWAYGIDLHSFIGRSPNDGAGTLTAYDRGIPYQLTLSTAITSAISASAGAATTLNVTSTTGFLAGNAVRITTTTGDTEYETSDWLISSITSGTALVINKAWSDDMVGTLYSWYPNFILGTFYDKNSPPVDKVYYTIVY